MAKDISDSEDMMADELGVVVEDNVGEARQAPIATQTETQGTLQNDHTEDEDEDLLGYDSDENNGADDGLYGSPGGTVREAAANLLRNKTLIEKVIVMYGTDKFLLFDSNKDSDSNKEKDDEDTCYPVMCTDSMVNYHTCNHLMTVIRRFLELYYGKLKFTSKEILLSIPSLDLMLCEDNVFNDKVTFEDIQTIFKILKERSETNHETDLPEVLTCIIQERPRFVSRFNSLVELTESAATLANIRPFSNDRGHPLILDEQIPNEGETIVMNLLDDDENEDEEAIIEERNNKKGNRDENEKSRDGEPANSDELLEIVSETDNDG